MIDIRQVVANIVKARTASDEAAFTAHAHGQVREYGQQLLGNLASAIAPTTNEEVAVVNWLQTKIVDIMKQIPQPKETP